MCGIAGIEFEVGRPPALEHLRRLFEDRVLSRDAFVASIFDTGSIPRSWAQHLRGTRDYSARLWALSVLESWANRFGLE